MIAETKTERGRTVLTVESQQEFDQAFGRMLDDHSIDIEAPPELLEENRIFDSADAYGLLDETD